MLDALRAALTAAEQRTEKLLAFLEHECDTHERNKVRSAASGDYLSAFKAETRAGSLAHVVLAARRIAKEPAARPEEG